MSPINFKEKNLMETKLKKRLPLREYLRQLTEEVMSREQRYNEDIAEKDPEKYIRNEFKLICR
jgi:hypothetical protein